MALDMNSFKTAEAAVRSVFGNIRLSAGLILGSGLSGAADMFNVKKTLDYRDIPGFGRATVEGHAGRMMLADHDGFGVFVFQGRRHWYEGGGWEPVVLPVYLMKVFGARLAVITNVAAGVRADLEPGRIMIIDDHINAMNSHPLLGGHDPFWGPRFPDQSEVYDSDLRAMIDAAAAADGKALAHGVYLAVSGPIYETPSEIRAFRSMGADAVGMSTVPEASLAKSAGLRVFGVSGIVNRGAGLSSAVLSHEEVTRRAADVIPDMKWLLLELLKREVMADMAEQ